MSPSMEVRSWEKIKYNGDPYTPRTGHTVASNGSMIYVFGGTDRRRRQHDLFQFDIASHSWSQIQTYGTLPPRRSGAVGVVNGNKLYIFGGYNGRDANYFNDLFSFDFETRRWDEMPSVISERPETRTDHIMVLYSSNLYVFGGYNNPGRFNDLWEYAIEHKKWSKVATTGDIPSRRFGHSGVIHASTNRLIVFGGWDGRVTLNDMFEYNFKTKVWKRMETHGESPRHRYRHTAVIYGDNMFVFGGVDKSQSRFNDFQRFDLLTNTWTEVCTTGSIPSSRTFHRAVVVGSHMYVLGGYDGNDRLQDLYTIDVGAVSPPSLLEICAEYVRENVESVLETTSFAGVSQDVLSEVIFRRDSENLLRSSCKKCSSGRCSVFRVRENPHDSSQVRDKTSAFQCKESACVCGHSSVDHMLVDEMKLYGKGSCDVTSSKVLVLYHSLYKLLFES